MTFEGSELRLVDLDGAFFERVDLRGAGSLSISNGRSLAGCLISDAQVQELAYGLALAGRRSNDPETDQRNGRHLTSCRGGSDRSLKSLRVDRGGFRAELLRGRPAAG